MSCEGYRDKLIAKLASGETALDGDLALHLRGCEKCKRFYEAQVALFEAIDSGVRAMVNEAVPASLLPRVRAGVMEVELPRRSWGVAWGFAAVTVAAVLVIGIGLLKRSPERITKLSVGPSVVEPSVHAPTIAPQAQPQVSAAGPGRHVTLTKTTRIPKESVDAPEVIVLAEERAAFVRFVSDLPEERDVAVAFTRPASRAGDEAIEIALLRIDELEVKPLESSNR